MPIPAVCICQSQTSWCNLLLNFFLGRPHFSLFLNVFDWLRILETRHLCAVRIVKVAGAPNLYSRVGKPHYEICVVMEVIINLRAGHTIILSINLIINFAL